MTKPWDDMTLEERGDALRREGEVKQRQIANLQLQLHEMEQTIQTLERRLPH
jgi:Tfp pilus assembly protein PilO